MTARSIQFLAEMRAWLLRSRISPARPLPSVRSLVRGRGLKHHEVQSMYDRLKGDGLVRSVPRVGFFAVPLTPAIRRRRIRSVLRAALEKPVAAALREGLGPPLLRLELLSMARRMRDEVWGPDGLPPTHRCHRRLTRG